MGRLTGNSKRKRSCDRRNGLAFRLQSNDIKLHKVPTTYRGVSGALNKTATIQYTLAPTPRPPKGGEQDSRRKTEKQLFLPKA